MNATSSGSSRSITVPADTNTHSPTARSGASSMDARRAPTFGVDGRARRIDGDDESGKTEAHRVQSAIPVAGPADRDAAPGRWFYLVTGASEDCRSAAMACTRSVADRIPIGSVSSSSATTTSRWMCWRSIRAAAITSGVERRTVDGRGGHQVADRQPGQLAHRYCAARARTRSVWLTTPTSEAGVSTTGRPPR